MKLTASTILRVAFPKACKAPGSSSTRRGISLVRSRLGDFMFLLHLYMFNLFLSVKRTVDYIVTKHVSEAYSWLLCHSIDFIERVVTHTRVFLFSF